METDMTRMIGLFSIAILLGFSAVLQAQDDGSYPMGDISQGVVPGAPSQFTGAVGVTIIDDEAFATIRLQPEISVGKFGVGFDVPLSFSVKDGDFRDEEYKDGVAWARVIRYLRWGQKKKDPVYVKVGDISGTTLGFGMVMYNYSNVGSYEKRAIGTDYDLNYDGKVGLEGMYSDFGNSGVIGFRPYVRPLRLAGAEIPVLRNLDVGFVYAKDMSDGASVSFDPITGVAGEGDEGVSAWGLDAGVPISLSKIVTVVPYAAFASIADVEVDGAEIDGGSGAAVGVNFNFNFVADIFSLGAKLERRFFGEGFVGSYFDGVYETNKFGFFADPTNEDARHPTARIEFADGTDGTFGSLYGQFLNKVTLGGSLQIPDNVKKDANGDVTNGAYLHLVALAPDLIPKIYLSGTYDRSFIEDLGDAFDLDEKSVLNARIAYKLYPYLLVGTDYRWTFANINGKTKATKYIFPFVALQFNLGG